MPQSPLLLTAIALTVVVVAVVLRKALKCSAGWRVWLLYSLNHAYAKWFLRWTSNTDCPWPESGPVILIANHTSPVDPLLIWMNHSANYADRSRVRLPNFLMAKEYFETPGVVGWISRTMQAIPTERNGQDTRPIREALRRLKQGRMLGIFPEGGINKTPNTLQPGLAGAAWLALKGQCPVFPVFIHDAPRGTTMVNSFYTRSRVRITYGEVLNLSAWTDKKPTAKVLAEVTSHMMQTLADLGGIEYDDKPVDRAESQ